MKPVAHRPGGSTWLAWLALGVFLVVLAGCGGGGHRVPVRGKVTLNGKPISGGTVTFIPTGETNEPPPEGKIDAEGNYSITTRGSEGAPLGTYRAIIEPDDKTTASLMAPEYSNLKKSPLTVEVTDNKPAGGYDLKAQSRR
jgi:hypothetical protein